MTPSSTPDDQRRVLTCRGTADFLAALPHLVGYTADDSIFVVFFSGSRTGQAMRLDLPPDETPGHTAPLLDFISGTLRGLDGERASPPAVVITCTRTFAESDGPPWRSLARRIERRLKRDGVRLRELCCRAPDGWISYLDPTAPRGGRPLSEIAESPIALEAGANGEAPRDLAELGAIPEPAPERRDAVLAALAELPPFEPAHFRSRTAGASSGGGRAPVPARREFAAVSAEQCTHPAPPEAYAWMHDTARVVEALRDEQRPLAPAMTARLIRCAQLPDRWLLLALGVLTRPLFPVELAEDLGPAQFVAVPVDLDAGSGPSRQAGWTLRRLLAHLSPEFTDQRRLPPLRERVIEAVSVTPDELRPALLAFSAWLWWLSGSQSVAAQQLGEALAIDPQHELARMTERLIAASPVARPLPSPVSSAA
ncbi:DUF4192 family protein [Leucobacter muris]|uniref:DUF4192 family protein n=1 Tax=Leucobacter muris TaxID=1935379 RepID=A0ABX5QH77_9MICO|nr:DUF4192 family protein [Leucobacter muris]QAB18380.1 DUF4192 family protein [Leucobacter muris]